MSVVPPDAEARRILGQNLLDHPAWWTHKIGGLHRNDFVMAAKTDVLYQP